MGDRSKKSAINTITALIMQIVIMVVGLILPRLYLKAYGSEVNGLVTSITQFISCFMLVEAGLSSAGINALFKPLSQSDFDATNKVLKAIKKFYLNVGYIFTGLVFGLALLYPLFVSVQGFNYFGILVLVFVLGLSGVIDFFTLSKYRCLLTADEKYYVVANATTISYLVNLVVVVLGVKLGLSITYVRILALSLYLLRSIIINVYVKKKYKYLSNKVEADNFALNKRFDATILQILGVVQNSLPIVLLTIFTSLETVSVYSIYNLVASSILSLLMATTNGVSATFGKIIASKDEDGLKSMFRVYETLFLTVTAIIYSCMMIMYIPFVKLYTLGITDVSYVYPITALLFVICGLTYNIKTPSGVLIGAAGVYKETKLATIIQTVIAVVLSLALVPFMGINGVLIGLIVSNVYRDIDLIIFMSKNVTKISCFESFKRAFICILICVISCLPLIKFEVVTNGVLEWILYAVISVVWSTIVAFIVNLAFNFKWFIKLLKKMKNKILKVK
jgi:O-antigen/teichoic acid export membrane protein